MNRRIVLGTRGSELAQTQARAVERAIQAKCPSVDIETKIIVTRGDQKKPVDTRAGWKGLFTAQIEKALVAGDIDFAVHSAKDLPSQINPKATIAAVLPRGPIDDALISKHPNGLGGLPERAIIATSSVRRRHQLRWKRPDLKIVELRGNVPTRLRKLEQHEWDAIVLARAGLERLGLRSERFLIEPLPCDCFLPAGGQGVIAIQTRTDDENTVRVVDLVNDIETFLCLRAEREFLRLLNVDCNAPVGVLATIDNGMMKMRAHFFEDDSAVPKEAQVKGERDEGEVLAAQLLDRLQLRARR